MVLRKLQRRHRRGSTLVETAIIIGLVLMIVMGVFEYSRLLMDWNLLNNSAREGCRYALANNTSGTVSTTVQTIVTNYMAGETNSFTGFNVALSGTHGGVSTPINNLGPGDPITVQVSGTYKFMNIIPGVNMPTNLVIRSGVTMLCEGGT